MMLTLPDGITELNAVITTVDQCLLQGFTHLSVAQISALAALKRVYQGTPLEDSLSTGLDALKSGLFQPEHFAVLAAARTALQGALYDSLLHHLRDQLGRQQQTAESVKEVYESAPPLLSSTGHWLMDIAIEGFARLEPSTILPFLNTLSQLQDETSHIALASLLTNFIHELLQYVPVQDAAAIPLYRWCDLWSRALMMTVKNPAAPTARPISGTLYPLGIDWRQQPNIISLVVYGVLESENGSEWVRLTRSAYCVDAIYEKEAWLLFPDLEMLLDCLVSGNALALTGMEYLPTGDLLWDPEKAAPDGGYRLMETATAYFGPDADQPYLIAGLTSSRHHPIHIAEPLVIENCVIEADDAGWRVQNDSFTFPLMANRIHQSDLDWEKLEEFNRLFGLVRYDDAAWYFQPLAVAKGKGKMRFVGLSGAKTLKKPPKTSTVSILSERASRLLRK